MARSMAYALAVVLIERVPSGGRAGLGADLVDTREAVQEAAQRAVAAGDVGECAVICVASAPVILAILYRWWEELVT